MSYTALQYHIVFSTKERRPFLSATDLLRTCEYIGGILREMGGQLLSANGMPDHVHLAAIVPASIAIADCLRTVKSNSSGWVHQTLPNLGAFGWQDGYAAFSVSVSVMPKVIEYIRTQAEHHATKTFQEELIALLRHHGVQYDERYIWA